jgi:hypothetical protein
MLIIIELNLISLIKLKSVSLEYYIFHRFMPNMALPGGFAMDGINSDVR